MSVFPDLWSDVKDITKDIPLLGGAADVLDSVNKVVDQMLELLQSLLNALTEIFQMAPILLIVGAGVWIFTMVGK